jgi:hypothetical protein
MIVRAESDGVTEPTHEPLRETPGQGLEQSDPAACTRPCSISVVMGVDRKSPLASFQVNVHDYAAGADLFSRPSRV